MNLSSARARTAPAVAAPQGAGAGGEAGLSSGSFLGRLDADERAALIAVGVNRRFPAGTTLMHQEEPDDRLMVLLSGRVKTERVDAEGKELLLSIRDPGDLLGELAYVDGKPRVASVVTLEPVEVTVMPGSAFRSHLRVAPAVAIALLEVLATRMRESTLDSLEAANADTMARVAGRIIELARRYGVTTDAGIAIDLPISQTELAAWTGASRAGANAALRQMRELGWIETQRRKLVVRDLDALQARAP